MPKGESKSKYFLGGVYIVVMFIRVLTSPTPCGAQKVRGKEVGKMTTDRMDRILALSRELEHLKSLFTGSLNRGDVEECLLLLDEIESLSIEIGRLKYRG
jgi:hypothetical protein